MRLSFGTVALAVSAATAQPAAAQDAHGLAPSTPWNIHYDDDSCALRRMFGAGEDQAYVELRRFGPGLGLQTIIGSKRMDARRPANFRYRFTTDTGWREVNGANTVTLGDGFSGVLFDATFLDVPELENEDDPLEGFSWRQTNDLPAMELEAGRQVNSITLRGAFRRDLTLQLDRLDAPIRALQQCIDELMVHWGIDVEAHKTLSRPAVPVNLREAGRMIDYPPKMIQQSMQGVVNIRLDIDETGRITQCHIQMPLSDPAFAESSCADIQHALDFDPALDKDGRPISSYWITKVRFVIR